MSDFNSIYKDYFNELSRYIEDCGFDSDKAQDIAQEVFMKFFESGYDPDKGKPMPYLKTIAKQCFGNQPKAELSIYDKGFAEWYLREEENLTKNKKKQLTYDICVGLVSGKTQREIAQELGVSEVEVSRALSKAKEYQQIAVSQVPEESQGYDDDLEEKTLERADVVDVEEFALDSIDREDSRIDLSTDGQHEIADLIDLGMTPTEISQDSGHSRMQVYRVKEKMKR